MPRRTSFDALQQRARGTCSYCCVSLFDKSTWSASRFRHFSPCEWADGRFKPRARRVEPRHFRPHVTFDKIETRLNVRVTPVQLRLTPLILPLRSVSPSDRFSGPERAGSSSDGEGPIVFATEASFAAVRSLSTVRKPVKYVLRHVSALAVPCLLLPGAYSVCRFQELYLVID